MLLKNFFQKFSNKESCTDYFRTVRQEVGIVCPECGGRDHKWLDGRKVLQCTKCGFRTPLTKNTVMEKSHIPLYDWFFTDHMMTSYKAGAFGKGSTVSVGEKGLSCCMADDDEVPRHYGQERLDIHIVRSGRNGYILLKFRKYLELSDPITDSLNSFYSLRVLENDSYGLVC